MGILYELWGSVQRSSRFDMVISVAGIMIFSIIELCAGSPQVSHHRRNEVFEGVSKEFNTESVYRTEYFMRFSQSCANSRPCPS
jgi:hypothetical protein